MSVAFAGERLKTKCPKCRSKDFLTLEVFEEIVICEVKSGVMPNTALDHQAGKILGISCECSRCGHEWRPRGARTITDIIVDE